MQQHLPEALRHREWTIRKVDNDVGVVLKLWHVNHLLCDECGCRIQEEEKFEEKEGIIVCRHCYLNGKNPKCA
ncbi:LIM domain protein, partial [Ostertagia ostertagi]